MLVFYILRVHRSFSVHTPNEYASRSKVFLWSLPIALLIMTVSFYFHSAAADKMGLDGQEIYQVHGLLGQYLSKPRLFEYFSAASSGFGDGSGILGVNQARRYQGTFG